MRILASSGSLRASRSALMSSSTVVLPLPHGPDSPMASGSNASSSTASDTVSAIACAARKSTFDGSSDHSRPRRFCTSVTIPPLHTPQVRRTDESTRVRDFRLLISVDQQPTHPGPAPPPYRVSAIERGLNCQASNTNGQKDIHNAQFEALLIIEHDPSPPLTFRGEPDQ